MRRTMGQSRHEEERVSTTEGRVALPCRGQSDTLGHPQAAEQQQHSEVPTPVPSAQIQQPPAPQ
jgi:hypothetical protein